MQQERLDIEEKYSTLQEEVAGKTKKLKKVWTMLMQAKSEVRLTVRKIESLEKDFKVENSTKSMFLKM